MTIIIVPRGHIWLHRISEEFQWKYLEIHRHVKIKDTTKLGWEEGCIIESIQSLQVGLANGDLVARYFGEEEIESVPRGFWARDGREGHITRGMLAYKMEEEMPLFVEASSYNAFVGLYEAAASMPGSKPDNFNQNESNLYVTPFVKIILDAIAHHRITETYAPPVKNLEEWFKEQKLPDGTAISPNQAKMMATFSRPPHLMRGGYQKTSKPSG